MESNLRSGTSMSLSTFLTDYVWPSNTGSPPGKPKKDEYYYPLGWVCPKCGSVYGPNVSQCWRCNPPMQITCVYQA